MTHSNVFSPFTLTLIRVPVRPAALKLTGLDKKIEKYGLLQPMYIQALVN